MTTWVNRVKNFLVYFWGTHNDKYVVDHNGNKIVFFSNAFQLSTKHESNYSLGTKHEANYSLRTKS